MQHNQEKWTELRGRVHILVLNVNGLNLPFKNIVYEEPPKAQNWRDYSTWPQNVPHIDGIQPSVGLA